MVGLKRPEKWIAMTETKPSKIRLENALDAALIRFQEVMNVPFPVMPELEVLESEPQFIAYARPVGDGVLIQVSDGVVGAVDQLWSDALNDELMGSAVIDLDVDKDTLIDLSLQWLMHHEMEHWNMGHFGINGGAALAETASSLSHALVRQVESKPVLMNELSGYERGLAPLCLELQADHDATEMVLGPYDPESWDQVRIHAAAIFSMLVLIELQDRGSETEDREKGPPTHPKAATRIFMMLGHVAEMWSIPARQEARNRNEASASEADLPSDEETESYTRQVVTPVFMDALKLAAAGGAEHVVRELGAIDDVIADIHRAQTAAHSDIDGFKTEGAREWATLWPVNGPVLKLLGLEGLDTNFRD